MADKSIILTQSQSSSSSGITCRGYVINSCDNSKVDDGSWSPTTYDGIGVSIDENKITVWNTNTTGSSVSNTFTWTSSKVSSCTKTLSVTAEGKDYCPSVRIELYDSGNNIISGTSTPGTTINLKITINDWKDIPESNKKKFDYFENGGNNIIYSLPDGYVMGFNLWNDDNNFSILGGLPDECPNGYYTFSVTICGNTTSKTTIKSTTHEELPCPDFYVSESDFTIYPHEYKVIRLHINNWNSTTITDYTFTNYFDVVVNSRKNMTYAVGSYNDIDEYYSITISHNYSETTSDSGDSINITINSKNGNCNNSANIRCILNVGYFNVTFNVNGNVQTPGVNVRVYIDCNGRTQTVAVLDGNTSELNQRSEPIWNSVLDTFQNAGTCPSRSFTVNVEYFGVVKNAYITSATSGTINNTCKSGDFYITCDVII